MLNNIKFLLNIKNDSLDELIALLINKTMLNVLTYCNITELNPTLESFIENKVTYLLKDVLSKRLNIGASEEEIIEVEKDVKTISRGDTSITYNTGTNTNDDSRALLEAMDLTKEDKIFLNQFRKLRFN